MRRILLFYSILLVSTKCFAGNEDVPVGARSAAMGGASATLTDIWSAQYNQAGLGFLRAAGAGVSYENRFLVKELSIRGGVAALPIKAGTFGLCITNFGYSQYNENKYSLSFAKAFGEKFSIGIALDYLSTHIAEGYGTKGNAIAEVGILSKPLKGLTVAAHVYNPTRSKLASYDDERIPTIIKIGGSYAFSTKLLVAVETEKDIQQKAQFKGGIEYLPVKELYLRIGVSTDPVLTSFGFGLHLKQFDIDLSANYHQTLGISPQLSLSYSFGKEDKTTKSIEK